ncbi:Integrase core domain [Popillia japonica]|uniref:Integrase core domain n=1 Tax=Popillia japonica TaxID=7064 RepID=A0AAW1ICZ4_POPJA
MLWLWKLGTFSSTTKVKIAECSFNVNSNKSRKCYGCGSLEHFRANCPKYQQSYRSRGRGRSYRNIGNRNISKGAYLSEEEPKVSFIANSLIQNSTSAGNINFVLDSGATDNLVCTIHKWSSNYKKTKYNLLPFKTATKPRSKRIGELLHSDICGPMFVSTKDEELYYLTIVDDFSHFCRVYLLKNKAEAKDYLVECIEELNASGNRVSRLRTDNGGEYTSKDLMDYCKRNGNKQEWTSSYAPQQGGVGGEYTSKDLMDYCKRNGNKQEWTSSYAPQQGGVAERMNRSLLNKLYTLPKENKLEPRAREYKMIGYAGSGYRLWCPINERIIISRDVVFDELNYNYVNEVNNKTANERYISTEINDIESREKEDVNEYISTEINEIESRGKEETNNGNEHKEIDEQERINAEMENAGEDDKRENTNVRKSSRERKQPEYLKDFLNEEETEHMVLNATSFVEELPTNLEEEEWEGAIKEEMNSLKRNNTWTLVEKPKNIKLIDSCKEKVLISMKPTHRLQD